jgi:hypothetical protein
MPFGTNAERLISGLLRQVNGEGNNPLYLGLKIRKTVVTPPGNPAICSSLKRPVAFRPRIAASLAFAGILEKQTLQKKSSYIFGKISLRY